MNPTATPIVDMNTLRKHSSDNDGLNQLRNPRDMEILVGVFLSLKPPYDDQDIRVFNAAYKSIDPRLTRKEVMIAERMVDMLILGLERPELASKIYGVF
jgi:hypothetical protein